MENVFYVILSYDYSVLKHAHFDETCVEISYFKLIGRNQNLFVVFMYVCMYVYKYVTLLQHLTFHSNHTVLFILR